MSLDDTSTTDVDTTVDTTDVSATTDAKTADASTTDTAVTTDDAPKSFFGEAPEHWRQDAVDNMRLNDPDAAERELKRLERYKTPQDWLKATHEAAAKLRKGEVQSGLPENPTDEQIAEYREANGIPAEATGYELDLGEGVTLSEGDQSIIDAMTPLAHAAIHNDNRNFVVFCYT